MAFVTLRLLSSRTECVERTARRNRMQASLHAVGGAIALLPLLVPAVGDFGVLTLVVSASMLFSLAQLTLTRRHPPDAASINPQHHLMKSTPLL
eukprot:3010428-Prymnesium_polylepis.1